MSRDFLKVRNPELKEEIQAIWDGLVVSGTPANAVAAEATITFSDVVSDGETVTIGDDVYEFDTDDDVTEGNIAVDVSVSQLGAAACTALVSASASGTEPATFEEGDGDTVVITADVKGTDAESIVTSTTCADASFDVAHLDGGVDGTVATGPTIYFSGTNIYICASNTISQANWKSVAVS